MDPDINELRERRICNKCVSETFVANLIRLGGARRRCSYCRKIRATFAMDDIANRVAVAFEEHFERTAAEPDAFEWALIKDREIEYHWSRSGMSTAEAIGEALGIDEEPASDLQQIFEEDNAPAASDYVDDEYQFGSEMYYERKTPSAQKWLLDWRWAEQSLLGDSRHFNRSLRDFLTRLFGDLREPSTPSGKNLIALAGPAHEITGFWRARFFQKHGVLEDALKAPEKQLGPPPFEFASAGRMNAQGVSVFYGADLPEVALAEIRPPVGSEVAVARFDLLRTVRLLNIAAFQNIVETGSIFDPSYLERATRSVFMGQLGDMLSVPVLPDDQLRGYLMTQAICDFLADSDGYDLDGLLFSSSQSAVTGTNVVLFHKASGVEEAKPTQGATIFCHLGGSYGEDEPPTHYAVVETKPKKKAEKPLAGLLPALDLYEPPSNDLAREVTLRLARDSLVVHHVGGVQITSSSLPVQWSTRQERDDF